MTVAAAVVLTSLSMMITRRNLSVTALEVKGVTYKFLLLAGVTVVFAAVQPSAVQAAGAGALSGTHAHGQTSSVVFVSAEQDVEQSKAFIQRLADRGIGFLSNPDLSHQQRKAEFKKLLQDSFDMKAIARFSLGRYWNVATEAERKQYFSLFERMIIEVYSRRFGEYNGEGFHVVSARGDGKSDAIVSTYILSDKGQKISLDWRVRQKGGSYKVIDIIVEGVSMATTQRSEFSSVIQRGGGQIQVLLDHLGKA